MLNTMSNNQFSPFVSAIVTTYNRPQLVKRALLSVRAQTYKSLEVIVVEDGTETGVADWLDQELPNAQYIRHKENRGLAAARNTGLEHASGEYIAYLDDDDEWKPKRIERQVTALDPLTSEHRDKIGAVYCAVERHAPDGSTKSVSYPQNRGELRASIQAIGASTLPSTFLFKREALRDVGGFDESLSSSIDHDIWMSLATNGYHAIALDEPLVISYISGRESMMTDTEPRIEGVRQYVKKWTPIYKEWFGPEKGTQYGERYFARVIARLASEKVVNLEFTEAWRAIFVIFEYSSQYQYNTLILADRICNRSVIKIFPPEIVDYLRTIKQRIQS